MVAYYAIAPHQMQRDEVPPAMAGGATVIPAYLLARMALDVTFHEQGLDAELLHDVLERIVTAADAASGRLVVIDAIDETAAAFYVTTTSNPCAATRTASSSRSAQSARHSAAEPTADVFAGVIISRSPDRGPLLQDKCNSV